MFGYTHLPEEMQYFCRGMAGTIGGKGRICANLCLLRQVASCNPGVCFWPRILAPASYDIIVYGGAFAGSRCQECRCSSPQEKVLLIVPDTSGLLGGLGTAGGQNFCDIRRWQGQLVTMGSFGRWFAEGQFYTLQLWLGLSAGLARI